MTIETAKHYARKRFVLNSPLKEEAVIEFEQQYGISLPDEYREFLLRVANGGHQSFRPLFRLNEGGEYTRILPLLDQPFQHTKDWNEFNAEEDDNDFYIQGALPFFHEGCGYYYFLVVTGSERGNIWMDARVSDGGVLPVKDTQTGQPITFFQWFKWWDEILSSFK